MKLWIVTYSDGYEFSGVFVAAFDDETEADLCCLELNEGLDASGADHANSYNVFETELGKVWRQ